jgi:cyanobactin maturation PatA/PatG family protease
VFIMEASKIMEQTIGDPSICIAVLDGPVDLTHQCFKKAKITQLETLVSSVADEGPSAHHGTHVASLIFGQHDSPIRGISPGCRGLIIPVFADGPDGSVAPCSQIDLAHAITQAVEQGAHVINISGGELVSSREPHPLLDKAVRLCAKNGVLIVAAVGNDGCQCLHVPAAISSTLAIGAMDTQGLPLDFSNWGQTYQNNGILALGEKLLGAVPGGGVTTKSGTSFATPIVSGIVALLLSIQIQRGDKPDPYAVRDAIFQSAHPCFPSEGLDCSRHLRGRLNIEGAYNLVTKRQQAVTDSNNSVQQIQGNTSIGLVESSKRPPVPGVQNAEFTTHNTEITTPSTQNSTLDAMKALENPDSIELKSIDKEKNEQTKNQIQEKNMAEVIDKTCGCPRKQAKKEEMNELDDQTSEGTGITVSHVHASDVQAAEPTMSNQEAATTSVMPSEVHPAACSTCGQQSLVYALGTLGYDFGSEARRDAFIQSMEGDWPNPEDPAQLLTHLEKNPEYAESLIWTLEIESTPVYAIRPMGSFASITYKRLCEFLEAQKTEGIERVSIPGVISGKMRLLSGQVVPVIIPEVRGMYTWSTDDLVREVVLALIGSAPEGANEKELKVRSEMKAEVEEGVRNFSERVYYELMNLGRVSQERAMNFAGTNAFQVASVFVQAASEKLMLDNIETERSSVCRPGSDCWDVKLTFFDPANRLTVARKIYRFTVDVSDVVPVTV